MSVGLILIEVDWFSSLSGFNGVMEKVTDRGLRLKVGDGELSGSSGTLLGTRSPARYERHCSVLLTCEAPFLIDRLVCLLD